MATKLDKDLIRESTTKSDDREIVVTLSANQDIRLKLKGMKSGEVKITIEELYAQLTGKTILDDVDDVVISNKKSLSIISGDDDEDDKPTKGAILIDLNDLRSMNAISTLDITTLGKFDGIIAELIKQKKEIMASIKIVKEKQKKK